MYILVYIHIEIYLFDVGISVALGRDGIASEASIPNDVAQRAATALRHAESQAAAYGASTVAVLCQQGTKGSMCRYKRCRSIYIY